MMLWLGQQAAWATSPEASRQSVTAQVSAYAQALLERDRAAIEESLSKEMIKKLHKKGREAGVVDPLGSYIEIERRKLAQ